MKITKDLDIKKFAQIVYEISMMTEVEESFFVRDIFSEKLWKSMDLETRQKIGKKFDQILQDENYRNIKKEDSTNEAHKYTKIR